jgi:hypothetical protein
MAAKPLAVAHVGHTGSDDDRQRWEEVCRWLRENDPPFYRRLRRQRQSGELDEHFIDLNGDPPRDFLAERFAYDVVITHFLWGLVNDEYDTGSGPTAQSPHHTCGNWRRRLLEANARYIFLIGAHFNAPDVGDDLPGYQSTFIGGIQYVTVYERTSRAGKS